MIIIATTRIIAMHVTKGKTLAQCLTDRTDYAQNPEKTRDELISTYACDKRTLDSEFALAKRQYSFFTGKEEKNNVIAYQLRQSFKPGEVSPGEAHQIGYDLAARLLKGRHAFIVCTHTDKAHIHNHIVWNSTTLDCKSKFRNFFGSAKAVARLSDLICVEHQLSVIDNPRRGGTAYSKWKGFKGKPSNRDTLRAEIDDALAQKPDNLDALFSTLEEAGYRIVNGKQIAFDHDGFKQKIRINSLGEEYSEDSLRAIIKGQKVHNPQKRRLVWEDDHPRTLIDIQAKLAEGKGEGYRRWATVENLKRMAKTKLYMDEHGLTYESMSARMTEFSAREKEITERLNAAQTRIEAITALTTNIVNYSKTRDVYADYKKSGYSKKFLADHEPDIIIHRAAKKAFDEMGVAKIPKIADLRSEFDELVRGKKEAYSELNSVRDKRRELAVHIANYEEMLNSAYRDEKRHEKENGMER